MKIIVATLLIMSLMFPAFAAESPNPGCDRRDGSSDCPVKK